MSFLARVSYTANGSTDTFSFSFPYILSSHVKVYVDGVEDTGITFPTTSTVQLSSTPANGAVVLIQRTTPSDARLVDFQDGSVLTSADLDQSADQNFYIAQETTDNVASKLGLDASGNYDAGSNRIINVANPVDTQDAVTKNYLENTWLSSSDKANINTLAGISGLSQLASNEANINLVAGEISPTNNISTLAGLDTEITSLSSISGDITTLAGFNSADISTVAGQISPTNNIQTVAGLNTEIPVVAGLSSEITNLDGISADITTVAGQISPTNNISTLAGLNTELSALYNIRTDITAVANISTDIQDVQDKIAELQTVANDLNEVTSEIETVAGSIANVDAVGADILGSNNIQTVANNINSVNSFANTYLGASATAPTQDPDGSALDLGDLYFDTASDTMKVYSSGGWINAGSAVNGTANRFKYTATASQTTFSGADDSGNTLAYDSGYADIYLNGVKLVNGSDFTATTGTSIVLTSGASANDILEVIAYGTFTLSNFSITDANDVPALGSAGQALVVNSGGTALEFSNASSAEVYGFETYYDPSTLTKTVTVQNVGGSNVYFIDSVQQDTLDLLEGNTYIFDWSSATGHPLRFSETSDGTHGGGTEYTSGVTVDTGAYTTTIVVGANTPTLYYYCQYHSGMGGTANTPVPADNSLRVITTNQGQDNISSSQYANFDDVLFSASGFTFSISNGELIATI